MDRHPRAALVKITPGLPLVKGATGDKTSVKLQQLLAAVERILHGAGSTTQALDAIREARALVVAQGAWRIEQEKMALLRRPSQVTAIDLMKSQEWIETRTVVVQALEPFPGAKEAVVQRLRALNARTNGHDSVG